MIWNDAVEDVIEAFTGSEDKLAKFIAKHGPVLSAKNRLALDECKQLASNHQFARNTGIEKEDEVAVEKLLKSPRRDRSAICQKLRA